MKKQLLNAFRPTLAKAIVLTCVLTACDDDDNPSSPNPNKPKCIIQSETTSLVGNEASWKYEYDAQGNLQKITRSNRYGQVDGTIEIAFDGMVRTHEQSIIKTGYDANIREALPSKAQVSITMNGVEQRNYYTYFFFYDSKNRLITVGEQTDYVANDWEWDLNITYNDQDNVTQLQYEWTTGPRELPPPITVKAHDDKPNPYAGVKNWKFFLSNFNWDNYDPEPVITALSQNNPLDYTMGTGEATFQRSMVYAYNEHGFPISRTNTNKNNNGEYTFVQTFAYECP